MIKQHCYEVTCQECSSLIQVIFEFKTPKVYFAKSPLCFKIITPFPSNLINITISRFHICLKFLFVGKINSHSFLVAGKLPELHQNNGENHSRTSPAMRHQCIQTDVQGIQYTQQELYGGKRESRSSYVSVRSSSQFHGYLWW